MQNRIYFLDNLRTFMIFLVVVLHAGITYEPILENHWIVSDPQKNSSIGLIRMYLDLFIMFSMFFISGYFIPSSLKNKNDGEFLISKLKRIMLPWLVAVMTLIPIFKAIFLYSRGLPQEEWYSYFHIFMREGSNFGSFANNPVQNWLWFLPVLFAFQIIYWLLSKTNVFAIKLSMKNAIIGSIIIAIAYSMLISALDLRGWYHSPVFHFQRERLLIYFLAFLLGSLANKLKVFEANRNKKMVIIVNVILSIALTLFTVFALNLFFNMIDPERDYYFISMIMDRLVYYITMVISMFSFLYVFLDLFRYKLNNVNPLMKVLNANSYSVYIIHLVVIGLVSLILINVSMPAMLKFAIVSIVGYTIANVLVYVYRISVRDFLRNKVFAYVIVGAAILITAGVYSRQNDVPDYSEIEISDQESAHGGKPGISIHAAAVTGDLEAIKQYIELGVDLNEKEPTGGSSPMLSAALFGHADIVKVLIDAGADINQRNNEGSTPLITASFFGRVEIVKTLLENGADKNMKNNQGSTALESVLAPFEMVKGIYDYFVSTLGPLGLELDYDQLKKDRMEIARILE